MTVSGASVVATRRNLGCRSLKMQWWVIAERNRRMRLLSICRRDGYVLPGDSDSTKAECRPVTLAVTSGREHQGTAEVSQVIQSTLSRGH